MKGRTSSRSTDRNARRRSAWIAAVPIALSLGLAACGGEDGSGGSTPSPSPTPSPTGGTPDDGVPVTGTISVNAATVLHSRPSDVGGTNILSHAANNFVTGVNGIDFGADAAQAKVPLIRTATYPDNRNSALPLDFFDRKFDAILRAGAKPLLVQYINPNLPYLREDGTAGGTVATNAAFLVRRYTDPNRRCTFDAARICTVPKLFIEVGNEPDITVDYRVPNAAAYYTTFNAVHSAMVNAGGGLRDRAALLGPAIAFGYRQQYFRTDADPDYKLRNEIMESFLANSNHAVDVVTYHSYSNEGATNANALFDVLNQPRHLDTKERHDRPVSRDFTNGVPTAAPADANDPTSFRGASAILALMSRYSFARNGNQRFAPLGVTEHNAGGADSGGQPNPIANTVQQGLWNLALTGFHVRSPFSALTASFVFDDPANNENFGHYDRANARNYAYWALWMRGNLTGSQVVEVATTGTPLNPFNVPTLLVTATKSDTSLFVEVINRGPSPVKTTLNLGGVTIRGAATVHRMANGVLPNATTTETIASGARPTFPAYSATVYRIPI